MGFQNLFSFFLIFSYLKYKDASIKNIVKKIKANTELTLQNDRLRLYLLTWSAEFIK